MTLARPHRRLAAFFFCRPTRFTPPYRPGPAVGRKRSHTMARETIPSKNLALLNFALSFPDVTGTTPASWGLIAASATTLATQVAAF
jgi:hypothetical protein